MIKVDNRSVEDWYQMVEKRQITLPRFQRFEIWKRTQTSALLGNIIRNPSLPIGAFLTLEVGAKQLFACKSISTAPSRSKTRITENLLDGQQRMTAIWRSLNDNYKQYTFFVRLSNLDSLENCPVVKIHEYRKSKDGYQIPNWMGSPAECLDKMLIPVKILAPTIDGERFKEKWISEACRDEKVSRNISNLVDKLRLRVRKYNIPAMMLPSIFNRAEAIDIFIKINTQGTKLTEFDIATSLLESQKKRSLHKMIKDLGSSVPTIYQHHDIQKIALNVGALIVGRVPGVATFTDPRFSSQLYKSWENVVRGVKKGTEFLQDEMIIRKEIFPTMFIVYLASALWTHVEGVNQEGQARKIIRKAIWRASFTTRYSSSVNSNLRADYKEISDIIDNPKSKGKPALFDEEKYPLPTIGEILECPWPSKANRLSKAIMAISFYKGGHDFASDAPITSENYDDREFHHIYPKYIVKENYSGKEVDSVLNCARIDWQTNRMIAAKSPKEYIREQAQLAGISINMVKSRLRSHMIPYNAVIKNDFKAFREERASLIHEAMQSLASGRDIRR